MADKNLTILANPEFQKDLKGLSQEDQDALLKSMGVSKTTQMLAPFVNPDPNKPLRKIDKQGADLTNRQQNDPRLIQPQNMTGDNGIIPGAYTGAKVALGVGAPMGLALDAASTAIPAIASKSPQILQALLGAGAGAGINAATGSKQSALMAALEGAAGGTITGKLLKGLMSKLGPEAKAAMSEAPPPGVPNIGGTAQIPSQLPPQPLAATPPINAPNTPATMIGGGSTLGALARSPIPAPVTPPAPSMLPERDLLSGKMLPTGVKAAQKLAEDVKGLSPSKIQEALDKLKAKAETESARQKLLDMMLPKK